MPLTKHYLRYKHSATLGIVNGRKSNVQLTGSVAERGRGRRALVVAPAVEDVVIWDPRRGDKVAVLHGNGGQEVSRLCLSASGSVLAAGCEDGCLRLWDMGTHEAMVSFSGHKSGITCLQFDHSGTRLVSGSKDSDVIVWDVVGECGLYRLRSHKGSITDCRLLHHCNVLITSSKDSLVKLWDLDTQHCFQTLVGHKSEVWAIELVAKETRLVTASGDRELQVFKLEKDLGERVGEGGWEVGGGEGEGEGVEESEGKAPGGRQGTVGKRRAREDKEEEEYRGKVPLTCSLMGVIHRTARERVLEMRSDPSGRLLGCLGAGCLDLFLVRSEEERQRVLKKRRKKAHKRAQQTEAEGEEEVSLAADDELPLFYTLSSKTKIRTFDLLPLSSEQLVVALGLQNNSIELHTMGTVATPPDHTHISSITAPGHRTDIRTLCFSSDDALIATGSAKMVKVWNRSTQQCAHTMASGYALCSTFVPGDRHLLIGTKAGYLQLFELGSGDLLEDVPAHSGAVWSLDVAPDKRGFVTGSADHDVKFWEFELVLDQDSTRRRLSVCHVRTLKMAEDVLSVCYSPDQRLLAVALLDATVKVFFADTLKFFLSLYGHKLPVLSMDISSDSTLLVTCSADKNIRIWGLDFGDCHKSLFAHDDSIMGVKFVPGTHLLFSCGKDRTVKCWDGDTFDHIMTLEGHCGEVWCLAISHDGDTVVTGSHDYSVRLWEKTEEPLILSEERERERETQFEEAVAEGGEPAIPGEGGGEVAMAGKKTLESMRAAEQLLEALAVYQEEKVKGEEWEEECRVARKELPHPRPHPILVAMGDIKPEKYVLHVVKRIKSSELEEALLVMPFSEVVEFLALLQLWIKNGWETELSCRCLLFLLRIHHTQIVSSRALLPVIDSLREHTRHQVESLRDMYGFNLAGLQSIQHELETAGTPVFGDVSELLRKIQKRRKVTVQRT